MSVKQIAFVLALGLGAASADPPKTEKPAAPAKKVAMVDINSASQEQLEALPGIGTEYCHHIIYGRPYVKTEELVSKGILPQEAYDRIKGLIVAKK
jgi:DNA uptake protein ComE-like DNA-binding protein